MLVPFLFLHFVRGQGVKKENAPCISHAEGGNSAVPPQFTGTSRYRPHGYKKYPCALTRTHGLSPTRFPFQPAAPECISGPKRFCSHQPQLLLAVPVSVLLSFNACIHYYKHRKVKSQGVSLSFSSISAAFCRIRGVSSPPLIIRAIWSIRSSLSRGWTWVYVLPSFTSF